MKKLTINLGDTKELTAYYTESQYGICIRDIYIYEDGNESNYDSSIIGSSIEEIESKLVEKYMNY